MYYLFFSILLHSHIYFLFLFFPASRRARVLATDTHAPVVAQTAVSADLLKSLEVVTQLHVKSVGRDLSVASILVILLTVKEPLGDLECARVGDNHHELLKLLRRQLSRALVDVNLSLLARERAETASHTADRLDGVHHLALSVDVGIQHTDDVLERVICHKVRHRESTFPTR